MLSKLFANRPSFQYFFKLPVGRKLLFGTTLLLTLLVLVSGAGAVCNWSLQSTFERAVNQGVHRLMLAAEVKDATSEMMLGQTRFVLLTLQNDPDASEAAKQSVHRYAGVAREAAKRLVESVSDPADREAAQQLSKSLVEWDDQFTEMENRLASENIPAAMAINDRLQPVYKNVSSLGEKIAQKQSAALESDKRSARVRSWITGLATTLVLTLAAVVGILVIRMVRATNSTLSDLSLHVETGGHNIAETASEVTRASQQLAHESTQQSVALCQTAEAAKSVAVVARQSSEWARDAVALTQETETQVREGDSRVQQLSQHMRSIAETGRKIMAIVSTVEEIAFQTKILSLNAAIEAAHAGDAGAGFSVVASEVKRLADRSAQAAKESDVLLAESAHSTTEGVKSIEAVEASIRAITGHCASVKQLISRIDSGTHEQKHSMTQIDSAIGNLVSATNSVAATARKSAAMAEEFNAESESLRTVVERLSGFIDGRDARHPHAAPPVRVACLSH